MNHRSNKLTVAVKVNGHIRRGIQKVKDAVLTYSAHSILTHMIRHKHTVNRKTTHTPEQDLRINKLLVHLAPSNSEEEISTQGSRGVVQVGACTCPVVVS